MTYRQNSIFLGSASIPVVAGSIMVGPHSPHTDTISKMLSGGALIASQINVLTKRPGARFVTLDPTAVTVFTEVKAGNPIESVNIVYWQKETDTFWSLDSIAGVLMPLGMSIEGRKSVETTLQYFPTFTGGTAWTIGTTAGVPKSIDNTYVLLDVTIGGDVISQAIKITVDNHWTVSDEGQQEPDCYFSEGYYRTGTMKFPDLSKLNLPRLVDGGVETVTIRLVNSKNDADIVTVAIGECYTRAKIIGATWILEFDEIRDPS